MARFTRLELLAMEEALSSRIAAQGEIDFDIDDAEFDLDHYEKAWDKVTDRINKMERS